MTDRQVEYLLLFAELSSRGRCIAGASETFGVSKATASSICSALEQKGYITKGAVGEIELTEAGEAYVSPMLQQVRKLENWLEVGLGLPPNLAENEARRMVVTLEKDTIHEIIQHWDEKPKATEKERANRFFETLAAGTYQVPFQICKKDTRDLSMGDQGFRKPATLIRSAEHCIFLIYPLEIQYSPDKNIRPHKGIAKRLWYRHGNSWYEMKSHADGSYMIPDIAAQCEKSPAENIARVRIRVRTTVSLFKMPESEADIVFQLGNMKPCKDSGKS